MNKIVKQSFLSKAISIIIILSTSTAIAEENVIIHLKKDQNFTAPYNGRFIPDDMFENMVKAGLDLQACNKKLTLIEEREKKICSVQINYEKEKFKIYRDFYTNYINTLENSLNKSNKWYRSPIIQFFLGAIVSVVVVWAMAYAFK